MSKIREWLKGKKAYLTIVVGVVGAVIAWADGSIDLMGLLTAVWAAASVAFIRAGIAKTE